MERSAVYPDPADVADRVVKRAGYHNTDLSDGIRRLVFEKIAEAMESKTPPTFEAIAKSVAVAGGYGDVFQAVFQRITLEELESAAAASNQSV